MSDLLRLMLAETEVGRRTAEYETASANLQIAKMRRNIAHLLSQHEPVATLGIDREALRYALAFVDHGDEKRCLREFKESKEAC